MSENTEEQAEQARPEEIQSPQIYPLMGRVMRDIGAVGKEGYNPHDKYNYRSIDQLYDRLHRPLSKHGVFYVPEVLEREHEYRQSRSGGQLCHTRIKVKYTFYAPDGSSIEATSCGENIDRGDKSINKALTAALKYLLIHTFCIPLKMDDADLDSPEPTEQKRPQFDPAASNGGENPADKPIKATTLDEVEALADEGHADKAKLIEAYNVSDLGDLNEQQGQYVLKILKQRKAEKQPAEQGATDGQ